MPACQACACCLVEKHWGGELGIDWTALKLDRLSCTSTATAQPKGTHSVAYQQHTSFRGAQVGRKAPLQVHKLAPQTQLKKGLFSLTYTYAARCVATVCRCHSHWRWPMPYTLRNRATLRGKLQLTRQTNSATQSAGMATADLSVPSESNAHSAEPGGGCHLSQGSPSVGTKPALALILTSYSTAPLSGKQAAAPSANHHACCERFRPWWRELQRFLAAWHSQGLNPATISRATS